MVELHGRALIPTNDALWVSDGTPSGTFALAERITLRGEAAHSGDLVAWTTDFGVLATDGTAAGTGHLAASGFDVAASPLVIDQRLLFVRNHPVFGHELFSLDLGGTAVADGHGCGPRAATPILRSGAPRLGQITRLRGDDLPGAGAAALLFSPRATQPTRIAGGPCALYGDVASLVVVPVAIANGRLDIPLTVPPAPAFHGARLSVQGVAGTIAGFEVSNGIELTLGW